VLANALSVLRILLVPLAIYSLYRSAQSSDSVFQSLTVTLLLTAAATDLLDGYVARRLGQVNQLGKILDPVADKLCIGFVSLALVWWREFPLWLLGIQLVRDLGIVTAGMVMLKRRRIVVSASRLGKYATVSMAVTMLIHIIQAPGLASEIMIWVTTALLVASTLGYVRHLLRPTAA
jgi:CDP-diacylglycerol--glycerol-3-phosphate 3-phosphatidyltransferase